MKDGKLVQYARGARGIIWENAEQGHVLLVAWLDISRGIAQVERQMSKRGWTARVFVSKQSESETETEAGSLL